MVESRKNILPRFVTASLMLFFEFNQKYTRSKKE